MSQELLSGGLSCREHHDEVEGIVARLGDGSSDFVEGESSRILSLGNIFFGCVKLDSRYDTDIILPWIVLHFFLLPLVLQINQQF